MIHTLHIQNYRSIREMSLELEQLNIVFGPNGTGKSNIYKAIHLMHSAAQGQFSQALANEGGILKVFWAGKTRSDQLRRMNLAVETESYEYELQVGFVEKLPYPSQFQLDPVMSGLLAFMAFLLVAAPYADGKISTQYLSGQGIFTALITAIYSTRVYAWLKQNNITIRLPKEVPTGVARSFEILIPVLVVIATLHPLNLFIEAQTGMILPQAIMHLLEPLVSASDSLPAILLSVLMCQIFWFAGIHGSLIVTGIMNPFWMANLSANQAALAAGTVLPHVYLQGFWDHYLLIGGVGSTLPLAFLLLRSRATHLRTIGKMGIVPSFFNINEPILFGAPIIMNPMMFIPFVCVPMVNAVLAYGATRLGWLSQVVSLTPWTTPAPIGASWAANWTLSPVVMCLICMVMSAVIYLPFLRAYERSLMKTEVEKAKNSVPVAETVS